MKQDAELTNKLLTQAALALAALVFWYMATGCNPYIATQPATATPAPSMTATAAKVYQPVTPTPRPSCVVVTGVPAGNLNLRSGPGTSSAVIGLLQEGETLTVIERGAWLEVETPQHKTGWVNSKFCTQEKTK